MATTLVKDHNHKKAAERKLTPSTKLEEATAYLKKYGFPRVNPKPEKTA